MSVTVEPVTADGPRLDAVAALFDAYRVHYGQPAAPAATRAWLVDQLVRDRLRILAAASDGGVRGFVTVAPTPASLLLGTAWGVRDLYVDPAHRRGGVARALVDRVVADARAAGVRRLSLQTEPDNAAALALYAGLGFRQLTGVHLLSLPLRE
jgi:ribosomal protein S18 acetylase RimI-like enzyme